MNDLPGIDMSTGSLGQGISSSSRYGFSRKTR